MLYPYPALPPAYPWLDGEAPGKPEGLSLTTDDNGQSTLSWDEPSDNITPKGAIRYNVYASTEYPVDTRKAENLTAMLLSTRSYSFSTIAKLLYGVHFAVTAVDRSGNESEAAQLDWDTCLSPKTALQRTPLTPLGTVVHP